MSLPTIRLCARSSLGVEFIDLRVPPDSAPLNGRISALDKDAVIAFADGAQFAAFRDKTDVHVYDERGLHAESPTPLRRIDNAADGVADVRFSPAARFIVVVNRAQANESRVTIYDTNTAAAVYAYRSRSAGADLFFADRDGVIVHRSADDTTAIEIRNVDDTGAVAPPTIVCSHNRRAIDAAAVASERTDDGQIAFATFSSVSPTAPANIALYTTADVTAPIVSASLYQCDEVTMKWSAANGAALAFESRTTRDSTNASYYGTSALHLLTIQAKRHTHVADGPIHDFAFSPSGRELMFIAGFQPAKTSMINVETAETTREYGVGPHNTIRIAPHGRFAMIGGFGNLSHGQMKFFDQFKFKLIGAAADPAGAKSYEWTPDSRMFVTAALRPWRRVDNGIKVFAYDGRLIASKTYSELYAVTVEPIRHTLFPNRPKSPNKLNTDDNSNAQPQPQRAAAPAAYVPPHLRQSAAANAVAISSVNQMIQQERKQNAKLTRIKTKRTDKQNANNHSPATAASSTSSASAPAPALAPAPASSSASSAPASADGARSLRNLEKTLRAIEALQARLDRGEQLDDSQRQKVESRGDILAQIAAAKQRDGTAK